MSFGCETEESRSDRVGDPMVMEVYQLWLVGPVELVVCRSVKFC